MKELEQIEQELAEGQDPIVTDDTPLTESKDVADFETRGPRTGFTFLVLLVKLCGFLSCLLFK